MLEFLYSFVLRLLFDSHSIKIEKRTNRYRIKNNFAYFEIKQALLLLYLYPMRCQQVESRGITGMA